MEVLLRFLYNTKAVMAVPLRSCSAAAIPLRIGLTRGGTTEVLNMFRQARSKQCLIGPAIEKLSAGDLGAG